MMLPFVSKRCEQPQSGFRTSTFAEFGDFDVLKRLTKRVRRANLRRRGSVFVEYILLVTLVGIGIIAGLATVRNALINELFDLANAINAINC
jgi:Flp pilus assembly pilin Flp